MLASLLSLPSAALSGTASFLANRRRGLTYTAGAIGGAYVLGQWAVQRVVESAEKGRKENWEREDLSRRFSLNLQDSQFTVLALVPTVASQLQQELDVEARSKALSDLARREKERRTDEVRRAQEADAAAAAAQEQEKQKEERRKAEEAQKALDAPAATPPSTGAPPSTSLNPAAPVFQPRSASPPVESSDAAPPAVIAESDGSSSVLGKSWAEIVKTAPPAPEAPIVEPETSTPSVETNGAKVGSAPAAVAEGQANVEANGAANGEANGGADGASAEPAVKTPMAPQEPEKSKAELWNEIKLLSFTRLITSLYVLVLLSLQTHVQLALLGRASYVDSLLSSLPPRTPPPAPSAALPAADSTVPAPLGADEKADHDLERALYEAKRLPPTTEERREEKERERKDLERKYLTFSWWLLHEGWKVVRERVEEAVEAVVGPMSLKAPLVYGELGALFGEIRRRIELDATTGKAFDFSSANHPPTSALEIQTLVSGGSYVPSPSPSSSSASSSSSDSFPPRVRRGSPDPITPSLRSLLNETNDALDSPDGALVRALSLDRLFALVVEKLEPAFTSSLSGTQEERGARFEDVTEKQARLASLLPLVTRLASADGGVLSTGVNSNEFVEALEDVRELREFSAVLYGSWDRDNIDASCVL
ncbi:microbody peroxisome biogenesis protein peroxin 3 [Rhodotorula diobovata]|uniref:Microbody peroxisome biogenesis protein peroxin 3 n=1 Tax=Rhodotorula diobovata TaxID=5288 RepID=A0A5C5FUV3_9BASI|nr:microbody peroxisome biogenesis protein peroxin 3 [Rhodotorula diobovata]